MGGRSNITVPFEVKLRFALLKKEYEELTKSRVSDADFLSVLIANYEDKKAENYLEIAERILNQVSNILAQKEGVEVERIKELEEKVKMLEKRIKELEEEKKRLEEEKKRISLDMILADKKALDELLSKLSPRKLWWAFALSVGKLDHPLAKKLMESLVEIGMELFKGDKIKWDNLAKLIRGYNL